MAYPINNFVVYMHVNKINNKKYIGITQQKVKKRWQRGEGYIRCPLFYNAIKKYGWDNFNHEILFENLSKEDACRIETELIKFYKSNDRNLGYNISDGGNCVWYGLHHSEETKKKISTTHKGRKLSEEHKAKLSIASSGKNNPMYGKSGIKSPVAKAVICLDNLTTYDCIAEAGRALNINISHISAVCKGKLHKTGGYRFMYLEDYFNLKNIGD